MRVSLSRLKFQQELKEIRSFRTIWVVQFGLRDFIILYLVYIFLCKNIGTWSTTITVNARWRIACHCIYTPWKTLIYLFNEQLFTDYLLCAKHYSRDWGYISKQAGKKIKQCRPQGFYVLVMGEGVMDYKQLYDK